MSDWSEGYWLPEGMMGPPGSGAAPAAPQGGNWDTIMNSPLFGMGLALMAGARERNPMAMALQSLQGMQSMALRRKQIEQEGNYQQGNLGVAKGKLKLEQESAPTEQAYKEAATGNLTAESKLHQTQADVALRNQQLANAILAARHPEWFAGQSSMGGGSGLAPPAAGGGLAPAGMDMGGGAGTSPQMLPAGYQPTAGQAPAATGFQRVNPDAEAFDIAFNGGKSLGGMYQEANKPITTQAGMVLLPMPDGSYKIAPGSLEAQRSNEEMTSAVRGNYGNMEVPLSNGQKIMLSPTEWRTYQMNGQLPSRYGGPATAAPTGTSGGNGAREPANYNYGNLRPQGSSNGFQSYGSPEEGLAAIDQNLQAYGKKGITTLAGVISRWAPPSENNTDAYIADAAKRTGIAPNAPIDLSNPAVRHIIGSAIMLHEQGPGAFVKTGVSAPSPAAPPQAAAAPTGLGGAQVGVTRSPEATVQAETPAKVAAAGQETTAKVDAEQMGKWFWTTQENATKAAGRKARMQDMAQVLDKYEKAGGQTGPLSPTVITMKSYAKSLGVDVGKDADYGQALQGMFKAINMELRDPSQGGGMPGQMSNYEDKLLQMMGPTIDKLPGANRLLMNVYMRAQDRQQAIARIFRENKGNTDAIMNQVEQLKNATPLFSPDEAKLIEGGGAGATASAPATSAIHVDDYLKKYKR